MLEPVYIVDAKRTAIGSFLGALKDFPAHKLGELVIRAILQGNHIDPSDISEVILGQVLTAGHGQNPARQTSINSGIPKEVPAFLVNQVCGSGLKSVVLGANSISLGYANVIIAGGQESMSTSMHAMPIRQGMKMGNLSAIDTMLSEGLVDAFNRYHMGITAENLSKKYNITRQEQDEFSFISQQNASKAIQQGRFENEIVPIEIVTKKQTTLFKEDEFVKKDTTLEILAKLKPAFDQNGTVTAGNSSGLNDGAAIVLLMNKKMVDKYKLEPLARIVSFGAAGVDPSVMGLGPIGAVKEALKRADWTVQDLDLIESNEAFAAQSLAVTKELQWDVSKFNVNGGAIALGHPIGASGARILTTLLHEMKRTKAGKGLATLCIGGGMGIAICVSRDV